jgi:crossover junction endodeoxyribonuclease RusA
MTSTTISMPWPPSGLSPNARKHWRSHAKAKKAYRNVGYLCAMEQCPIRPKGASFDLELVFLPPDRRRYDLDGLVSRMKAGLDGIAECWELDDRLFVRVSAEIAPSTRGTGEVRVRVSEHFRPPITVDL